jgi:teichuronic acid exporter
MGQIKSQSLSGVKWSAIERFANQGINFGIGIVLARLLTPSDFGIVGMLAIFMAVSQSFIDSGFSNALIRKKDVTEADFSTVFYFNIVVGIVCYSILFLIAPWVAKFFNIPLLKNILRIMAVNVFFNSLIVVQIAKLTINIDFKTQAKTSLSASIISGAIGIVCAYMGYGVWSLVAQSVIQTFLNAVFLWLMAKWHPQWIYSWKSFRELFAFGSRLLVSGLIHQVYVQMTTLAIGKFYSAKDLGYYTRGNQFANLPSSNLTSVLQRVTYPILAKMQDNDSRLVEVYRKYIKLTSLVIFFSMILLAALAKPLILLLLTNRWAGSIIYLRIFCFALLFDHITIINLNLLQVKGRSDLYLKLEVIKKSISIVILLISIPFGVIAICVSKIIYSQIALFINTYYTGKIFGLTYFNQLKDFIFYLFTAVISCSPALTIAVLVDCHWLSLIVGVVISSLFYCIILFWSKDEIFIEYIYIPAKKWIKRT